MLIEDTHRVSGLHWRMAYVKEGTLLFYLCLEDVKILWELSKSHEGILSELEIYPICDTRHRIPYIDPEYTWTKHLEHLSRTL
jgi:hypothetical protein